MSVREHEQSLATSPPTARLDSLPGMWQAIVGWHAVFIACVAFNVIAHLATALATAAGAWAVSLAFFGASPGELVVPALLTGIGIVVRAISTWLESWLSHDLSFRMLARSRIWMYDAVTRIGPVGIQRRRSGDLLTTATSDAESLEIYYAHSSIYNVSAWVSTPLLVAGLATINLPAALAVVPVLAVAVAVTLAARRWAVPHGREIRTALSGLGSDIAEEAGAAREIVGFGLTSQRRAHIDRADARLSRAQFRNARRAGAETAVLGVVSMIAALVGAAVAGWQVREGALEPFMVPIVIVLAGATTSAILQWAAMTRHYGGTKQAAARITELIQAPAPVTDYGDARRPVNADDEPVRVDRVGFSWRDVDPEASGRAALRSVDVTVPPRSSVALAGRSGAGKSTLAQLLARFMDPSAGSISAGGHPLPSYSRQSLAEMVSLLPQDVALFAETVRDNLLLAVDGPVDDETLWDALRLAQADEIVARMSAGLDTVLSENGASLSGGERQRIALARAVLHPATVLILDESVSQLDMMTEDDVHGALETARAGRATITIAHRLSTLLRAGRILVLDDGELVGDGTHAELLESCPSYRRLVLPQLLATE